MAKNAGSRASDGNGGGSLDQVEDEIDALFKLPLAEFTSGRNTLAARLKKEGRPNDADRIKLLAKPSISAWTVNQLYWNHRDAFDELIATGKRFGSNQASRPGGKLANMRDSLDARRDALTHLSDLATKLLRDAGHNPTPDTIRRITTTLEAMSAYALLPNGPTPGRLTNDVDPPSFESLASLMSGTGAMDHTPDPARTKAATTPTPKTPQKDTADIRRLQEVRQARIAAAKASLQDGKKSLADARARTQSLEAAQKKANAEVREAEKQRREAEARLEHATSVSEEATRRAESVAVQAAEATQAVDEAKRTVEDATKELELLLRESPAK